MKEILCLSTYPPRQCGIATFSDDLIRSIHQKFASTYALRVCALESDIEQHSYEEIVKYRLNTDQASSFRDFAQAVQADADVRLLLIQHEFGLFHENEQAFLEMLEAIHQPIVVVFHTVMAKPNGPLRDQVRRIAAACQRIVVMTQTSSLLLQHQYRIDAAHIAVIAHGTHLVAHQDKKALKAKYGLSGRRILSTFGLLSAGKSIETTLDALPALIANHPSVLFLIIGKTHPSVLKREGEAYRQSLETKVEQLELGQYVRFINSYLELPTLLEYLQLTDVYLFTSCDPNQAVSGTFVYALSCGCPIVATPIPHALELLSDRSGLIFDFKNAPQLAEASHRLLSNEALRHRMKIIGLQKIMATAWENAAIAHALLFHDVIGDNEPLQYSLPPIHTAHLKRMSQHLAMIQFSKGNRPDLKTGFTIDDNARALTALTEAFRGAGDASLKKYIRKYLDFIAFCQQADGSFLNYVDSDGRFTTQNNEVNLNDSNGRTVYALGHFIAHAENLPNSWTLYAQELLLKALPPLLAINSPRSVAFILKGLCDYCQKFPSPEISEMIQTLANRLLTYYDQHQSPQWKWFEVNLTYDNSVLPEALLYAYLNTSDERYKTVAKESFDFLLHLIFKDDRIQVVSNDGWLYQGKTAKKYGEQPIDVSSAVMVLTTFYAVFGEPSYLCQRTQAFDWFLGRNHLHQILYNPATGGCYDGLEQHNVNINQGAESTVCYLLARLAMERYR